MDLFIQSSARDDSTYILKSEHALVLKKLEDELIADMRSQLVKGHAEMRRKTAEAVGTAMADQRAEITRPEKDSQHFADPLAETMNEVTRLRNKHQDVGEWVYDEEYEEGGDGDDSDTLYRAEAEHQDAAGVGELDYDERVRTIKTRSFLESIGFCVRGKECSSGRCCGSI